MTDTLNENTESGTVCNTPETDAEANNGSLCDQCVPAEFARKLERERDAARELSINLEVSLTAAIRSANVQQEKAEQAVVERNEAINALEEIHDNSLEIQHIKYGYDGCCGATHIAVLIERKCEETINRIKKQEQ